MNTKYYSKFILIVLVLFLLLSSFSITYATGGTVEKQTTNTTSKKNEMFQEVEDPRDPGLPTVTVDDMSRWTERKGFEVIGFLQKFIQPFAIIIFIVGGIVALTGVFGNGNQVSKGLISMFIALIIYVVVLYAPEIMDIFLNWIRS